MTNVALCASSCTTLITTSRRLVPKEGRGGRAFSEVGEEVGGYL